MRYSAHRICLTVLAATISLSAMAAIPDSRPRPEDYASYSLYLQALFDYQKARPVEHPKLMPPTASSPAPESLDDAIAKASSSDNSQYQDVAHSSFDNFGLRPLSGSDMSATGVNGVLGIYGNHELEYAPELSMLDRPDSPFYLVPVEERRSLFDDYFRELANVDEEAGIASRRIHLSEGWGEADGYSQVNPDGSLTVFLSSSVVTTAYIVDEDGTSEYRHAGAFIINPLRLSIEGVAATLRAVNSPQNGVSLDTTVIANRPIRADLSGTRIGVADALDNGPRSGLILDEVGPPTYFLSFGENSQLEIAPGTVIRTSLSRPDGHRRPLITLSARISGLNLTNISLVDNVGGSQFNIANFSLAELLLKQLKIYVIDRKIELDSDIRNVKLAAEGISVSPAGFAGTTTSAGDLYMSAQRMQGSITFSAH